MILFKSNKLKQVANKIKNYKMEILGISETIQLGSGEITLSKGMSLIYSAFGNLEAKHKHID